MKEAKQTGDVGQKTKWQEQAYVQNGANVIPLEVMKISEWGPSLI